MTWQPAERIRREDLKRRELVDSKGTDLREITQMYVYKIKKFLTFIQLVCTKNLNRNGKSYYCFILSKLSEKNMWKQFSKKIRK